MAVFRPFQAVRPAPRQASKVAALPYDVMSSQEAREMVKDNPLSFLHVDRAEIDLNPSIDLYDRKVYEKAADNLNQMQQEGILIQDNRPCYYIYRQIMDGRVQTGLVGCASIDDYLNGHIKRHELTREDKEQDRICHVDTCDANTGPIFLTYRAHREISALLDQWTKSHQPVYDFVTEDEISHIVWIIDDGKMMDELQKHFAAISSFYIADGHHRAASAVRVGQKRRREHPGYNGSEEFNYFLAVLFPDDELKILDYNRVIKDLNGMTPRQFMERLSAICEIIPMERCGGCHPTKCHTMGMYLEGKWYRLAIRKPFCQESDPVENLDVSILQKQVLTPILGIEDPRTSERISFVGGVRGLEELEKMVEDDYAVAFAMYPTSLDDLMTIADCGEIMPPKSTWFEPKLRSGLFIHKL